MTADAELMSVLLAWSPRIDVGRISADSGLSPERTVLALTRLAASGRVGYDPAEQSFFPRELPFGPVLEKLHPRLADARALIASGAVTPCDGGASVRGLLRDATVSSDGQSEESFLQNTLKSC